MRIGLFTDTYSPNINGVSTSVATLKRALEKKGHEVYVVTINDSFIKYDYDLENRVLRIPGIPTGIYDYRLGRIYPVKVIKTIKDWKLDIIHSNTEFSVGTFARLFAKQFDVPLVHTYHTWYEDYVYYLTKGHADKASKKVVEYLTKFYCDTTATELIVPTKKIYDLFRRKYKFEKNINIIPTGIETERFYEENIDKKQVIKIRKSCQLLRNDFVLTYVGRLANEKNFEMTLEIVKKVVDKYSNVKFLVVGDGPAKLGYIDLVEEMGIQKNVIFVGKVPWEEVPYYYNLSDLFITCSTSETQGLTLLESMASSVVPLCIRDEAFLETIVDGFNGIIFDSVDEAVNKIIELYKNDKERNQLKKQARIYAEKYETKYFAEAALKVYERAILEKKNSRNFISKFIDKMKGE